MDPIKILKFQASHKHKKNHQSLNNIFLYFLTAIACSLFCFSPLWLPSLSSSMKVFVFDFVPKINSVFLSSKFVFLLGNLIVVALIGESKIFSTGSSQTSIVDQYESMKRVQTPRISTHQGKERERLGTSVEKRVVKKRSCNGDGEAFTAVAKASFSNGDGEAFTAVAKASFPSRENPIEGKACRKENMKAVEKVKEDIDHEDDDEEFNLGGDDDLKLNQRADDFIARVNERRRFELTLDNCFCNGE